MIATTYILSRSTDVMNLYRYRYGSRQRKWVGPPLHFRRTIREQEIDEIRQPPIHTQGNDGYSHRQC